MFLRSDKSLLRYIVAYSSDNVRHYAHLLRSEINRHYFDMGGIAVGLGFVLAIVAAVLVIGQVDALSVAGKGATSGAIAPFFESPMFIVTIVTVGVGIFGAMAVLSRYFR